MWLHLLPPLRTEKHPELILPHLCVSIKLSNIVTEINDINMSRNLTEMSKSRQIHNIHY